MNLLEMMLRSATFVACWISLVTSEVFAEAAQIRDAEAVMPLLELFVAGGNRVAITKSAFLLDRQHKSFSVSLEGDLELRWPKTIKGWEQRQWEREALHELGVRVARLEDGLLPEGLPSPERLGGNRMVASFFAGLADGARRDTGRKNLDKLLDESWLQLAKDCGVYSIYFPMSARRRGLGVLLQEYESATDEIGLMVLGQTLVAYPALIQELDVKPYATRTLALFLSGYFGSSTQSYRKKLRVGAEFAVSWSRIHPELLAVLDDLCRRPSVMTFCEVETLRRNGRHELAVRRLFEEAPDVWLADRHGFLGYVDELVFDGIGTSGLLSKGVGWFPPELQEAAAKRLERKMKVWMREANRIRGGTELRASRIKAREARNRGRHSDVLKAEPLQEGQDR